MQWRIASIKHFTRHDAFGFLISEGIQSDFDFLTRRWDSSAAAFEASQDPQGENPEESSSFRLYGIFDDTSESKACFDFGDLCPSLESMAFLDENEFGEWCLTKCFSADKSTDVPLIVIQEIEPEPSIASIQSSTFNLALTVERKCESGARMVAENRSYSATAQQFAQHFDGSFASGMCPGLHIDSFGSDCERDEIMLYQKEQPTESTVDTERCYINGAQFWHLV